MRRALVVCLACAVTLTAGIATAGAAPRTRGCGYVRWGIGWQLRATPNVSCARARVVFKDCFAGPTHPKRCSEGYRCTQRGNIATGVTTETCVRGRREVIGRGGP